MKKNKQNKQLSATQRCKEFEKSELYAELSNEIIRAVTYKKIFKAKLIADLICNLHSSVFNNIVLLDKNLYDRFKDEFFCYKVIDLLEQFIVDNKIKLSE